MTFHCKIRPGRSHRKKHSELLDQTSRFAQLHPVNTHRTRDTTLPFQDRISITCSDLHGLFGLARAIMWASRPQGFIHAFQKIM